MIKLLKGKININKKTILTTSLVILVFVMGLGYAALAQHMDLDGIATIDRSWIVKIKSLSCSKSGTATVDSTSFVSNTAVINGTIGDSESMITCTIVLENQGNLKAKLSSVDVVQDDNNLITYSYSGVSEGTSLDPGNTNTVTLSIGYADGVETLENTKKSIMLTFVYVENEPGTSNNPTTPPTYTSYTLGDKVTLVDGSTWYVTKTSDSKESLVTLISAHTVDSTGAVHAGSTYNHAFDTTGSTYYDTSSNTNIGYFIDNSVLPKIKSSINAAGGSSTYTKARLITLTEFYNLASKFGSTSGTWRNEFWDVSGSFLTMEHSTSSGGCVYLIATSTSTQPNPSCLSGVRNGLVKPVIITEKSNVKAPSDTTGPVVSISSTSNTNWAKTHPLTIYVNDSSALASGNSYQYCLTTSTSSVSSCSWTGYSRGSSFTAGTGLTGDYYLYVKQVKDTYGNSSTASGATNVTISGTVYHRYGPYRFDNTPPVINVSTWESVSDGYNGGLHFIATITDADSGVVKRAQVHDSESSYSSAGPLLEKRGRSFSGGTVNSTYSYNSTPAGTLVPKWDAFYILYLAAEDAAGNQTFYQSPYRLYPCSTNGKTTKGNSTYCPGGTK